MRMNSKRIFWFFSLLAGLLICAPIIDGHADDMNENHRRLTILHLCDVYEVMPVGTDGKQGGFARLKSLVDRIRWEDPQALLFLSGDFLSPSLMSQVFKGRQMIDLLNRIGVDFAMPGNHEFDFGAKVLMDRVAESNFTWISSNILTRGNKTPPWYRYGLREVNGLKVGVFSLLTPETRELARDTDMFHFTDPVRTGRRMVRQLKSMGAEVIIAMTHLDYEEDQRLSHAVPGIDIILGGHDHIISREVLGRTLIVESGSDLRALGRIDYDPRRTKKRTPVRFIPITDAIGDDPEMAAQLLRYQHRLKKSLGNAIGTTSVALNAKRVDNRTRETNLGNLIADAGRLAARADIGLQNGGIIRSDATYGPGTLTREDIQRILPFNNFLVKVSVSGKTLREILETGVSQMDRVKGRFLQVSGLEMAVDRSYLPGHRVLSVKVGGIPLDPEKTYTLAINDYIAEGGDGFFMLKNAPRLISAKYGPKISEMVSRYIADNKRIEPKTTGRIHFVDDDEGNE